VVADLLEPARRHVARAITSAGTMAGGTAAIDAALVPAWLQIWMPPEMVELFQALVASFGPMVQSLLAMVPALGGW
jgi:hypothetical protein